MTTTEPRTSTSLAAPSAPTPSRTTVVRREPLGDAPIARRKVRGVPRGQTYSTVGALVVALSATTLLFGRLAPFSGAIAFVGVAYVLFIATYAALISQTERGPAVADGIATAVLWSSAVAVLVAIASVIIFTVAKGWPALHHGNFFTQDLHKTQPLDPLTKGGIEHAIVGTLWTVGIALVITVPLGFAAAVYLNESTGPLTRLIRTVVNAMTALPDILAGLFIYAVLVIPFHFSTGMAAGLALGIMALPIIIRTSDVVLRLIPGNLREAALALGGSRWRTAWVVVLPTARSGLATAVILGAARAVGETAPVLLTAGYTTYLNTNPLNGPMVSLPLAAYELVGSGLHATQVPRGFGAATVLLFIVIALFVVARLIGGRGAGQISDRARRRAVRRSQLEARRRDAAASGPAPAPLPAPDPQGAPA